jgi:hypothetical protein
MKMPTGQIVLKFGENGLLELSFFMSAVWTGASSEGRLLPGL